MYVRQSQAISNIVAVAIRTHTDKLLEDIKRNNQEAIERVLAQKEFTDLDEALHVLIGTPRHVTLPRLLSTSYTSRNPSRAVYDARLTAAGYISDSARNAMLDPVTQARVRLTIALGVTKKPWKDISPLVTNFSIDLSAATDLAGVVKAIDTFTAGL